MQLIFIVNFILSGMLSTVYKTDIVIFQASTGGTTAAIESARHGSDVILLEPHDWLGGMLTSAGVSAVDGNDQLPSGLWGEFRDSLQNHYGNKDALFTGWVSKTMFEPHVGDQIFKNICSKFPNLHIWYNTTWSTVKRIGNKWKITTKQNNQILTIYASLIIDATDMGDIAAMVGTKYDIGFERKSITGEAIALDSAVNIIQDLTYVAILKDYHGQAPLVKKPDNYSISSYLCSCDTFDCNEKKHTCSSMLNYGKLPNDKYMINWPIHGNDFYDNLIEKDEIERQKVILNAKNHTLGFIYFIQHDLGWRHLGLADDEFKTKDLLPYIPYYREGRRIHGLSRLTMNHAFNPFATPEALYRTGIAVGDYPVDHHHGSNTNVPKLDYVPIPSFNVPLGCLIPDGVDGLILADKAISVSNIMNGATRLQPVILQVGQAAGLLASQSIKNKTSPASIPIRDIQQILIKEKMYTLPYLDVKPTDLDFEVIQKIGLTGILRGKGLSKGWSNETWFYPDSLLSTNEFIKGYNDFYKSMPIHQLNITTKCVNKDVLIKLSPILKNNPNQFDGDIYEPMTKREIAVWINKNWKPFEKYKVKWNGMVVPN